MKHPPLGFFGKLTLASSIVALAVVAGTSATRTRKGTGAAVTPAGPVQAAKQERLPLHFEKNAGQTASQVRYLARGQGYTLFLTPREAVLTLARKSAKGHGRDASAVLRTRFVGANPQPAIAGAEQLAGRVNYYLGKDPSRWHSDVPTFGKVRYEDLYPGVDLVYYGKQGELEYDFQVAPGADPGRIRLSLAGAKDVSIDRSGDLVLRTPQGEMRHRKPVAYQEIDGRRTPVTSRYVLLAKADATHPALVGFRTAEYRKDQPLVIDPTLSYSTFLGGSGADEALGGVGPIVGSTTSIDFPVYNAQFPQSVGLTDAFVASVNLGCLVFSTYLGGSGDDSARAIISTNFGYWVAGATGSADFPTLGGAPQPNSGGGQDGFVAFLSSTGALGYSTFLGGSGTDVVSALVRDNNDALYVAGTTTSSNFPILNASQPTLGGGSDAFVTKLAGAAPVWSTYYGGTGDEEGNGITLDSLSTPTLWLTGTTSGGLPAAPSGFLTAGGGSPHGGATDAFVATLNAASSARITRDYLGGADADTGRAIDADLHGNVYITGQTSSSNFPVTYSTAAFTSLQGGADAYVTKLSLSNGLVYSSYLGGTGNDEGRAIFADKQPPGGGLSNGPNVIDYIDHCYVGGATSGGFPTVNADSGLGGQGQDGFVAHLDTTPNDSCSLKIWGSTQLGGQESDVVNAIAGTFGQIVVAGGTNSPGFPITAGAYQTTLGGSVGGSSAPSDAFITSLTLNPRGPNPPTNLTAQTRVSSSGAVYIHLEWTNNEALGTGYTVRRWSEFDSPISEAAYVGSVTATGSTVTFDDTFVNANTLYAYYVETGSCLVTAASNTAAATAGVPKSPGAPVAKVVSATAVRLYWGPGVGDADGFRIYRSLASASPVFTLIAQMTRSQATQVGPNGLGSLTYLDTGLSPNTTYQYRLRATNAVGESVDATPPTNEAQATTLTDPLVPGFPTDLDAVANGDSIDVSWMDNSDNETGFEVELEIWYTDHSLTSVGMVGANVTSLHSSGLEPGVQYKYRIRAVNANASPVRYSAYTNQASASVNSSGAYPSKPCDLAATLLSNGVRLDWRFHGNPATHFDIKRQTNGGTLTTIGTVYNPGRSFTDTTAVVGNTYSYYVSDVGSFNSNEISETAGPVTISVGAPEAPSGLTAIKLTSTDVKLIWADNSTNETSFVLERSVNGGAYTVIRTLGTNLTVHVDTGLDPELRYQYRVKAANPLGSSAYSNVVTVENPPSAPTALAATAVSASQINLSWSDTSSNETGFKVERSLNGTSFTLLNTTPANATSYSDTGLTANTTYYYRVRATNAAGDSAYTSVASATTGLNPPSAPSGLTATALSATQIRLTWTDNSSNENGFKVERSSDNFAAPANTTLITTTAANTTLYTDSTVSPATTYYYRVRATNTGGDSANSNVASATTPDVPPAAPTGLTATAVSSSQINLSWTDNSSNETSFDVEMLVGGFFFFAGSTSPNVTTFSSFGLSANTTYTYRVRASNSAGSSGYSNEASATTLSPDPNAIPIAPTFLNATAVSQTQINLAWSDQSDNETGFLVERMDSGGSFTQIGSTSANVASYSDTGLTANTTYSYRVRATNAGGNSAYSNTATATTFPNAPAAPTNLIATATSSSVINLSWTDNSSDEQRFEIEQLQSNGSYVVAASTSANVSTRNMVGLQPNTSYTFRVRAYNVGGYSAYTNSASATTFEASPGAPSGLTATAVSQTQINLTWTDNSTNETGFKIERSLDGTNYTLINTLGPNATAYADGTLSAATLYYYRVRATNTGGDSAYTSASATTLPYPPSSPTGLTATAVSTSQINLSWTDASNNETGFKVERSTDGTNFTQIATTGANATSYSNTGLTAATQYYYRVRATNTGGDSGYTTVASATTLLNAPSAPTGLTATAVSQTQINLSWTDTSSNETGFKVERSTDGTNFTLLTTTAANVTSYSDTGLTAATQYFYRVRATNTGGDSSNATANATTLPNPPSAPTGLTATAVSQTQINLAWTDTSGNETGFKIERSLDGTTFTLLTTTTANVTSYSNTGLTAATQYFYRVRATNTGGDSSNATANATTLPNPPSAPTGLTATAVSQTQINLSWTDTSSNETGFKVERSLDGTSFTLLTTTAANATSYSSTGLTAATQYYYRVRATNTGGDSTNATANATTLPNPPSAPTGLTATAVSQTQINLSWTDTSSNETGFKIERSLNGTTYTLITTTAANATSYSDAGLTAAIRYYYRVRATNTGGDSSNATANATTLPNPPSAPAGLTATAVSQTQINLAWTDTSGDETGFKIERSLDGTTFTLLTTTTANVTSYSSTGLTAATQYYYRVRATNTGGDSSNATANATTLPNPPSAPTGLTAMVVSQTQVNLSWTDTSTNETGFEVERSLNGTTFTLLTTTAANATSYSDTGLTAATLYYYRVRAINAGGVSGYATANATTLPNPPAAPSALTVVLPAAPNGITQLMLSWTDNSTNETGFAIERSTDNFATPGNLVVVTTTGVNVTSYTDTGLTANTTYQYQVRAVNTGGYSAYSSTASGTTLPNPPAAPSNLTVTRVGTQFNLTWSDNSNNETGFEVERRIGSGSYTVIATVGADVTSYSDTGLQENTGYTYRVLASNSGGDSAYAISSSVTMPFNAPTDLVATVFSNSRIDLTWQNHSGGTTGFRIERSTSNTFPAGSTVVSAVGATVTSFSSTGLAGGTTYYFRVCVGNTSAVSSDYSNVEESRTSVPADPTDLVATAVSSSQINLTWTDNANNETEYRILRSGNGTDYNLIDTIGRNSTSYSATGLQPNKKYWFKVRAVNDIGNNVSSAANATTFP